MYFKTLKCLREETPRPFPVHVLLHSQRDLDLAVQQQKMGFLLSSVLQTFCSASGFSEFNNEKLACLKMETLFGLMFLTCFKETVSKWGHPGSIGFSLPSARRLPYFGI